MRPLVVIIILILVLIGTAFGTYFFLDSSAGSPTDVFEPILPSPSENSTSTQ